MKKKKLLVTLLGLNWIKNEHGNISPDKQELPQNLEQLPLDSNFSYFRFMRMELGWIANKRPDLLFDIYQLEQVTDERLTNHKKGIIKRIKSTVKWAV